MSNDWPHPSDLGGCSFCDQYATSSVAGRGVALAACDNHHTRMLRAAGLDDTSPTRRRTVLGTGCGYLVLLCAAVVVVAVTVGLVRWVLG